MRRITIMMFAVLLALCAVALGQQLVNVQRPASSGGFVDVRVPTGTVRVTGTDEMTLSVTGALIGADARLLVDSGKEVTTVRVADGGGDLQVAVPKYSRVEVRGDSLLVQVAELVGLLHLDVPRGILRVTGSPREVDLSSLQAEVDVDVVGTRVNVSSQQGPVSLQMRHTEVDASTVSGPMTVMGEDIEGRFQSVSGDVAVTASASRIQVSSSSGAVTLNLKGGEADVTTMSGGISARGDRFDRGVFESYTGPITFESGPERNGRLRMKSHGGEVQVRIPGASNEVTVSTQSGPIKVIGDAVERGVIESGTGRVTFEGNVKKNGALDVKTDGAVELALPQDVDARFRIAAPKGKIDNAFGDQGASGELDFSTRGGNAWINVKSRGDVWVRKLPEPALSGPRSEAEGLFHAAMARAGHVSVDETLEALREVLRKDRTYAPAHYELAKLYMGFNTPSHRQWALRALREAIRLDEDNVAYQVTLGDLLSAQGFSHNAERQYKKVLEIAPQNAHAAFKIGRSKLHDFLRYSALSHLDRRSDETGENYTWVRWDDWSKKDREAALVYLKQSIESDPDYRDAYYNLGLLHLESGQPDSLVMVSKKLLEHKPNDKDALLFCGLGYQHLGNMTLAADFYTRALAQMSEAERAMMESVDLITEQEDQKEIASAEDGLHRFWVKKDPLLLTDFNERQMAHYGRIAYANLRFSWPERNIVGSQTDMGEAYIKYGRFLGRRAGRGNYEFRTFFFDRFPRRDERLAEMAMDSPNFEVPTAELSGFVESASETWYYEDFRLHFSGDEGYGGRQMSEAPRASRYADPYRFVKYHMPYQMAAFREQDSVRIELAYSLPRFKLRVDSTQQSVDLEDGVFVFDSDWREIRREVKTARVQLPASSGVAEDSLRRNNLMSVSELRVSPGNYRLVSEVRDLGAGSIGTFRTHRVFGFSDSMLAVSDLMLAERITSSNPFPEVRSDLKIVPQPTRTFAQSDPVFVYLEVYNLTRNEFGKTDYEIAYQVGVPNESEIDPGMFMAIDFAPGPARVEVVAGRESPMVGLEEAEVHEYATNDPNAFIRTSEADGMRQVFSVRGSRARSEAWRRRTLQSLEVPVDYQVKYVLPKARVPQVQPGVGADGSTMETSVTAEYEGERRDDLTYLQVDISQVPAGVHKLTVRVKDRHTGSTVTRSALFRVVE